MELAGNSRIHIFVEDDLASCGAGPIVKCGLAGRANIVNYLKLPLALQLANQFDLLIFAVSTPHYIFIEKFEGVVVIGPAIKNKI